MPMILVHGKPEKSEGETAFPMVIPAERYQFFPTNKNYPANPEWCNTFLTPYESVVVPVGGDQKTGCVFYGHHYETLEVAETVEQIWAQIRRIQEPKT